MILFTPCADLPPSDHRVVIIASLVDPQHPRQRVKEPMLIEQFVDLPGIQAEETARFVSNPAAPTRVSSRVITISHGRNG